MAIDPRDPDASLVVLFRLHAERNEAKSVAEGRPIFDDVEVCDIRLPGSRNYGTYPAHTRSHWRIDPYSGSQTEITYAQRFPRQYEQFCAHAAQTKSGTPLDYAPFITAGRRAELRAQNIYTVEQLAAIDGQELRTTQRTPSWSPSSTRCAPRTWRSSRISRQRARRPSSPAISSTK
jgi:hypothetical protein